MDKIDLLLDVIGHSDRYTEKDIEALLADLEIREIYNVLDNTKSALSQISTPDIESEWRTFKKSHTVKQKRRSFGTLNLFTRNIAASISAGVISIAAVASIVGVSVHRGLDGEDEEIEIVNTAAAAKSEGVISGDTSVTVGKVVASVPRVIVFDNEPLETIAIRIAEYYDYRVEFSADASKSLRLYFRWNQANTLDEVVESLNNFGQINISVKDKTLRID